MRLFLIEIRNEGRTFGFTAIARTSFDALENAQNTFGLGIRITVKPVLR